MARLILLGALHRRLKEKKKEELRTISKRVLRKTNQGKAQDLLISANAASM